MRCQPTDRPALLHHHEPTFTCRHDMELLVRRTGPDSGPGATARLQRRGGHVAGTADVVVVALRGIRERANRECPSAGGSRT